MNYLHDRGFHKVPYPYGVDHNDNEILSYVDGIVHNGLLPEDVMSDEALISVATVMSEYHALGEEYSKTLSGNEKWMLPLREPVETMCHGDFAPYNLAMKGKKVSGIIDFDTLHPGPRMWDIAYALYRWIPLMSPDNPENFGKEEDKIKRMDLFLASYGVEHYKLSEVIEWVINRLQYLIHFMQEEARSGNEIFVRNIEAGHLDQYIKDIEYINLIKDK
ncbi:aminoglycoside phosphotransferase family protein [Mobilitalea sibirica]|uniref:aminoglycoside phosphotransferase family protein n=1 Tax=Mobilitalea sibirica TaxID=1462919 RepID=UPI0018D395FB|nr:aminoglycoside phosphotransferase family protein [Mobilitalea sibirica]